jgi:uncharacterized protein (TIGR02757 family)
MNQIILKEFLDEKVQLYNNPRFIESDPIQIPHLFNHKEDIEIAGFLTATIAWGNRKMIINNAHKLMHLMGNSPYDFIMEHQEHHLDALDGFVHRTFNNQDCKTFIKALHHIYTHHNGLETIFTQYQQNNSLQSSITEFKKVFFEVNHLPRTTKHISDPSKGSAAKRLNMLIQLNNVVSIFN